MNSGILWIAMLAGLALSSSIFVLVFKFIMGLWEVNHLNKAKLTLAKESSQPNTLEFQLELPDEKNLQSIEQAVKTFESMEDGIKIKIIRT